MALASHEDHLEVADLGASAPDFRPGPLAGRVRMGAVIGFTTRCHRAAGARRVALQSLVAAMQGETRAARLRRIAAAKQEDQPERLLRLGVALRLLDDHTSAAPLLAWTFQRHPDHPEIRLESARAAANLWQWARVDELLAGLDLGSLDDGSAQHIHHLHGAALLFLGRHAEALALLRRAAAASSYPEGRCDLSVLLALALPAEDEESESAPEAVSWSPDQALLRAILHAVTAADASLARGDAAGALRALDCLAVAESHEVQSLARRAEALLLDDAGEARRFETAYALASFCGAHAEKDPYARVELPLPCGIWDGARLDALAERASRWLDATLGEAWPMPAGGF